VGSSHTWAEHTGELELELAADSPEELFAEAAVALGGLLAGHEPGAGAGEAVEVEVEVCAGDPSTLLAEWLAELAYLAERRGLVPERVADLRLAETTIRATVRGYLGRPPPLVKAVTYHRLEMRAVDGGWRGRAVLDV